MTERVHYSEAPVTLPLPLNPVQLAEKLSNRTTVTLGRFKTNLLIRYLPNVSTETAGSVAFSVSKTLHTSFASIAAVYPSYVGPVWKPATLNVSKSILNLQSWSTADSECLYLASSAAQGTFTLTTTLSLVSSTAREEVDEPDDPYIDLAEISTVGFVGPRLEGFSLVCCAPSDLTDWRGDGVSINVDLTSAKALCSTAAIGLKTPTTKQYIGVRFGMSSSYNMTYDRRNRGFSWSSDSQLYSFRKDTAVAAIEPTFFAQWRKIDGNPSGWAFIETSRTWEVVNGSRFEYYVPMCLLILYYHYPGTDIFDSNFKPGIIANPGRLMPLPPGAAVPEKIQSVPMLMGILQSLWSPYWKPLLDNEQFTRFEKAKQALLEWPVVEQ